MTDPQPDKRKKFLIIFVAASDVIFGIIGCLLVAFGVLIMTNYLWDDMAKDTLLFIPNLTLLANISGSNGWTEEEIAHISLDMSTIAREPAVIMLCMGATLVLLTLLGFVNCCDDETTLILVVNVVIISILVVSEIVLSALFWIGQFTPAMKSKINDTLTEEYFGAEGKYDVSVAWNYFMLEMECCGLEGYQDFQHASRWARNYTRLYGGANEIVTLAIPLTCCKFTGDFPFEADYVDVNNCMLKPTMYSNISNIDQGCWESVGNYLDEKTYTTIAFYTTVALLALQGLLWIGIIICSILRILNEHKKKKANRVSTEPEKDQNTEDIALGEDKQNNKKHLIHVQPEHRLNSFMFGDL